MEIIYFHRKNGKGTISIQENFRPIIEGLSKKYLTKVYNVPYSGSNPIKIIKNIIFIRKHSSKNGINHITGDIHYGILGLIGRKSVLTIHDDYAYRLARFGPLDKFYKWLFWIFFPIRFSTAPVCTTPSTLKLIKKLYNSKKLSVITHQVVPTELVYIPKIFDKNNLRFLQIGTAVNKNLETTLKVLKNFRCKLIVLKPMTESQKKLAQDLGIDYENKYDLPYDQVIEEYNLCDIVLFPSLFEGMGVPIFEAQAAGRPVITTNREPMNWVAGQGALLLDNPTDEIEYEAKLRDLIDNEELRERLINLGLDNSKRFSLAKAIANYEELYNSII